MTTCCSIASFPHQFFDLHNFIIIIWRRWAHILTSFSYSSFCSSYSSSSSIVHLQHFFLSAQLRIRFEQLEHNSSWKFLQDNVINLFLPLFLSLSRIRFYAVAAFGPCVRLRVCGHPRHQLAIGPESAGRCGPVDASRSARGGVCGAPHRDHCGEAGSCDATTAPGANEAAVPEQQVAHNMQHRSVPVGERVGL